MRLSSLADYAVVVMSAAARHGADARLSATSLASETGVPLPTAQKVMGKMAGAGLLTSARGAGGGFMLARPVEEISVADIVEAVDGPIAIAQCLHDKPSDCALESNCAVRPHWSLINVRVREALSDVSLAAIVAAERVGEPA